MFKQTFWLTIGYSKTLEIIILRIYLAYHILLEI